MKHETKKVNEIIINDTFENFDLWINKDFISDELKAELRKADILLVPVLENSEKKISVFADHSENVFLFLKNKMPLNYKVDICVEDNDYKELALHYDLTNLGAFICTYLALPLFINLISQYIYERISKIRKDQAIKVSITTVGKKGLSKKIEYEGNAEYFPQIIEKLKELGDDFK